MVSVLLILKKKSACRRHHVTELRWRVFFFNWVKVIGKGGEGRVASGDRNSRGDRETETDRHTHRETETERKST